MNDLLPGLGLFGVGLFGVGLFRVGLGLAFAASTIAATAGVKAHDQGLAGVAYRIATGRLRDRSRRARHGRSLPHTRLPTGDVVERLLSGYHSGCGSLPDSHFLPSQGLCLSRERQSPDG